MLSRKETREVQKNEDDLSKGTKKLNRIMEDRQNNVDKLAEIIETEVKRNKERVREIQETLLKVQSDIENTTSLNEKSENYLDRIQDVHKDLVAEQMQSERKLQELIVECEEKIQFWKNEQVLKNQDLETTKMELSKQKHLMKRLDIKLMVA